MTHYDRLKELAKDYLKARHIFLSASKELPDLHGNDNIIGRIGELIALQYFRLQNIEVKKTKSLTQKGFDLETIQGARISVKIITAENNKGRTTTIKEPWTELIVIELNSNYEVDKLGHMTKQSFDQALKKGFIKTKQVYADRKLLVNNGFFERYGILKKGKDVEDFL